MSVTGVVGVAFEDGEGTVNLLEENDASKFVREGHLAEGKDGTGDIASMIAEPIGRTDGEEERLRIPVLVVLEEAREFFGGQLFPA